MSRPSSRTAERGCRLCGDPRIHGRGLCQACYRHWWRHGTDRPVELVIRQTRRDVERQHEQELHRSRARRYSY